MVLSQQNTVPVPMELKLSATTALTKTEPGLQPHWTRWLHVNSLPSRAGWSPAFQSVKTLQTRTLLWRSGQVEGSKASAVNKLFLKAVSHEAK